MKSFRELGTHCAGHPEIDPAAGIEVTTGPLGQGVANALGMAIAEAHLRARFGAHLVDHRVWAFVGDGCLQEDVGQELIQLAGHLKLGRLTFLWDDDGGADLEGPHEPQPPARRLHRREPGRTLRPSRRARARDGFAREWDRRARGAIPLAFTYLAFADDERPAMRMAALMGLPVIFAFSHDSIGVGKNGPTHQPVGILASLRAMPDMLALRPADPVATAECQEIALDPRTGLPRVCPRQAGPTLRRDGASQNRAARGGYVLAEAEGGARRVTPIGSGTEVAVAMAARDILQAAGAPAAVVSLPSGELFAAEPPAWRAAVLGEGTVRAASRRPSASAGSAGWASAAHSCA